MSKQKPPPTPKPGEGTQKTGKVQKPKPTPKPTPKPSKGTKVSRKV